MLLTNDLRRHTASVRALTEQAVARVLDRGWYVFGPELEAFEHEFSRYCGTSFCAGVGNGTDALELALRALGVGPGDRVATVANAGMYSTTAILACGATPVYIEIDPRTMLMDPAALEASAAIIATHLYGRMAPMPAILQQANGTPVIEDCAQAHGATLEGRKAGSWGVAGCFSFYPTKNLGAFGDGGAVVTSDAAIHSRVSALRQYGWTGKYTSSISGGRNSRLDEVQAAVLRAKLPLLDGWNQRRREIASRYALAPRGAADDVVHLYVVRTRERERLRDELRLRGIGADVHYPLPDYRQASVVERIGSRVALAETEACCREVLTVPCFPEMTEEEVLYVRQSLIETTGVRAESLLI